MPVAPSGGVSNGVAFLVSSYGVYEVIAACCSSPQTTEINADKRAGTLMKWVHVGVVQAGVLVAIAVYIDPQHRAAILGGALLAAGFMEASYFHAKRSGLSRGGPTTENW